MKVTNRQMILPHQRLIDKMLKFKNFKFIFYPLAWGVAGSQLHFPPVIPLYQKKSKPKIFAPVK